MAEELSISQPEISEEFAGPPGAAGRKAQGRGAEEPGGTHRRGRGPRHGATLIQADQFGTSIAKALRVHAETLRTRRRQQVEEQAAKTAVKLVFPLVFFIFPSLFVVALGPAMIKMMEGFADVLSEIELEF